MIAKPYRVFHKYIKKVHIRTYAVFILNKIYKYRRFF